jgi:hypothetical protein
MRGRERHEAVRRSMDRSPGDTARCGVVRPGPTDDDDASVDAPRGGVPSDLGQRSRLSRPRAAKADDLWSSAFDLNGLFLSDLSTREVLNLELLLRRFLCHVCSHRCRIRLRLTPGTRLEFEIDQAHRHAMVMPYGRCRAGQAYPKSTRDHPPTTARSFSREREKTREVMESN